MKMFVRAVKRAEFFTQEYERSGYETRSSWTTHLPVEIGLKCAASEIADRARMALCTQYSFFRSFTNGAYQ
jgi:hypothetical protein